MESWSESLSPLAEVSGEHAAGINPVAVNDEHGYAFSQEEYGVVAQSDFAKRCKVKDSRTRAHS